MILASHAYETGRNPFSNDASSWTNADVEILMIKITAIHTESDVIQRLRVDLSAAGMLY